MKTFGILHNIRSIHNVGSMFRTADALGVSTLFLTGYTPGPLDRFGRPRANFAKVSLGAEKSVKYQSVKNINTVLNQLKKEKVQIVGVELHPSAKNYKKFKLKKPTAFIFGNETEGLPKEILKKCDELIEIPMKGIKESLNVSVSFGIIFSNF